MRPSRRARAASAGTSRAGRRARLRRALASASLALGIAGLAAPAAGAGDHVAVAPLTGTIDQVNAAFVEEAIRTAADGGAAAIVFQIDSPGGELTSMDRIIKAILASEIPVITHVAPEGARAVSAATFVLLAGDVAAMAPNTNIGAASVVDATGQDLPDTLERKVTNDAVARIRSLADRSERNADWAEEAVRRAVSIGAAEAVELEPPVVDLIAGDVPALLAEIDRGERVDGRAFTFEGAPIALLAELPRRELSMNPGQQFLHLLSDPNVAFILFTIGFYGIVAELFHPNFFSGILGAIAIVLAFIGSNSLPLNIGGLLLILIGIGLFALEVNVASYGLLTAGGLVAFVLGAFALYTDIDPGVDAISVQVSPLLVGLVALVMVGLLALIARGLLDVRRRASPTEPMVALVGASGTAQTLIAPTGIAYAGGEAWSARTTSGDIGPGTPVRVVGVDGLELIVEPEPGRPASTPTEEGSGV